MIKCVPTSEALNVQHHPPGAVHKADGGGLWWMRVERPSRGYIEISISSWHQIRLDVQKPSAFQNADEVSRVLAEVIGRTDFYVFLCKQRINVAYLRVMYDLYAILLFPKFL